ncbi:NAD-dependent epimerase/dehydratase family protein [Actinomyces sp. ZJ308]|uniref:NAD-dependent epimerase/dehydratase family protein n=1 Tax=Actinomyces sp. ZJ308 TaxID=2708342 RepID=UPI001FB9B20E|nr:NAD-dependent epimerase/dehydratase family protein [Actinomyces sp. ZJ308]
MSQAASGHRIGVIGSHGAVGRMLVELLRRSGCEVVCANRTRRTPDEGSFLVDARNAAGVREFAQGCGVVVNCAGPSYIIRDSVAGALPSGTIYVDPFGGSVFNDYDGQCACVINAGCTPGLSGLLARYVARRLDRCVSVTVCSGGREQGGVAGFADVILSTRDGYGYPGQMLVDGAPCPYVKRDGEEADMDSFPSDAEAVHSPFVTDELRNVASAHGIPMLTGMLVIPDRDSLHLLLKAMTSSHTDDPDELMRMFSRIDGSKSRLDAGRENWFALQVSARGYVGNSFRRVGVTVRAQDSSELSSIILAEVVFRCLDIDQLRGVHWGCEFLDPNSVIGSLESSGVTIEHATAHHATETRPDNELVESGFV